MQHSLNKGSQCFNAADVRPFYRPEVPGLLHSNGIQKLAPSAFSLQDMLIWNYFFPSLLLTLFIKIIIYKHNIGVKAVSKFNFQLSSHFDFS